MEFVHLSTGSKG